MAVVRVVLLLVAIALVAPAYASMCLLSLSRGATRLDSRSHRPPLALCVRYLLLLLATGFDLSYFQGTVSQSAFSCLKSNGYVFGCIQATAGTGGYVGLVLLALVPTSTTRSPTILCLRSWR